MFSQACFNNSVHRRGTCLARTPPGMHAPMGTHTPRHAHPPARYYEMLSMSGRYASYWNAFLFRADFKRSKLARIPWNALLFEIWLNPNFLKKNFTWLHGENYPNNRLTPPLRLTTPSPLVWELKSTHFITNYSIFKFHQKKHDYPFQFYNWYFLVDSKALTRICDVN